MITVLYKSTCLFTYLLSYLYVADIQYKTERVWILSMIADGLREHLDYKICEKRFVVKILLTFYDSPLADSQTQVTALPCAF